MPRIFLAKDRGDPLPPGVLTGVTVQVQGVGFDPDRGLFRTNCEQQTL